MKRPDAMILKRILGKHTVGDEDHHHIVKRALEVPLLDFTNKADAREFEWAQTSKELSTEEAVNVDEWAFDEFVFVYRRPITLTTPNKTDSTLPNGWQFYDRTTSEIDTTATVWTYINKYIQDPILLAMDGYPDDVWDGLDKLRVERGFKNPISAMYYTTQFVIYDDGKTVYRWDGFFGQSGDDEALWVPTIGTEAFYPDEQITGLSQHATWTYGGIVRLMTYLKYGDKHLVEVLPSKPKTRSRSEFSKKRPWLNATVPRMLLLDRMPATQRGDHKGGTHASPKPHRRRGHWKTLSHPKYRHHPQYQKQIYVKPSFVGPKQVTYEGNIYRVIEPLH